MSETKNPLLSKTVLGAIGMVASVLIGKYMNVEIDPDSIAGFIDEGLLAVFFIQTIIGRATADKKLSLPWSK